MGYGRASSDKVLEPDVILALANKMGLPVSQEEAEMLSALLMNQLAAVDSFNAFDLQDIVAGADLSAGSRRVAWTQTRRHKPADTDCQRKRAMTELTDLSLSEVSDLLSAGETSSVELVQANLLAIEKTEPSRPCLRQHPCRRSAGGGRACGCRDSSGRSARPSARRAHRHQRQYLYQGHRHRIRLTSDGRFPAGI